jgi:hypothetical protein
LCSLIRSGQERPARRFAQQATSEGCRGGDDRVGALAAQIGGEAREVPQLAAGLPAGAQAGEQPPERLPVGAQGQGVGGKRGGPVELDDARLGRDQGQEVAAPAADDEIDGEAPADQLARQAQERGADPAAAEAAEQQRDPAPVGHGGARAHVRRALRC